MPPDPTPTPPEASLPERIGHYRILGLLGKGGMGSVFGAEQDSPRRTVALKVLSMSVVNDEMRRRFELEAQVLGLLQHPCIAQVYEAGMFESTGGAQPYFAMELIRGVPLVQYANERGLDTQARLELLARICDGVQHAHQRGVIHRDLKPDNILVDEEGQPKILDFGLARATDSDVQAASLHTNVGQIMGTIPYMSPEQALGDPARIDTRSDVYSLGVVAYELVSGHMPYPANDPAVIEALRVVREEEAKPLSSVNHSLRGDVETIVGKALEKEPGRRYATVSDMAADVRRHLNDEPITARPPSAGYQLRKFARRNKALVGGVAAVFVALVIGLFGTARGYVAAAANAERAQSAADFFQTILTGVDPVVARGADATLLRSILDDTAARVDDELGGQPLVAATIHDTMAITYYSIAEFESSVEQARAARELYLRELGPDSVEAIRAQHSVGVALGKLERREEAHAVLVECLERAERVLGPEHATADLVRFSKGVLYLDEHDFDAAAVPLERVLAYRREHCEAGSDDLVAAVNELGIARMGQMRYDEAGPMLEEVLETRERVSGPAHPDTIKALINLASLYDYQERFADAEALRRKAVERGERVLGPEHQTTLMARQALANALRKQYRHEEAIEVQRAVFETRVALHGPEDPRTLQSEDALGLNYRVAGQYELAEQHAQHATDGLREWFGAEHTETLSAMINLATAYGKRGKRDLSEEMRLELIESYTRVAGPEHPKTLLVMGDLAMQYWGEGRLAESEPLSREVLEKRRRVLGDGHSDTLMALALLARLMHDNGRADEALRLHTEFLVGWPQLFGDEHAYAGDVARKIAEDLGRVERLGPHEAAIRTLLHYHQRTLPADSPQITADLLHHAECLVDLERSEEAREVLEMLSQRFAARNESPPARWTFLASSTGLVSFGDAEAALVEAFWEEAMASTPDKRRRIATWLADLLESLERPEDAEFWREEAGALAQ